MRAEKRREEKRSEEKRRQDKTRQEKRREEKRRGGYLFTLHLNYQSTLLYICFPLHELNSFQYVCFQYVYRPQLLIQPKKNKPKKSNVQIHQWKWMGKISSSTFIVSLSETSIRFLYSKVSCCSSSFSVYIYWEGVGKVLGSGFGLGYGSGSGEK